MRKKRTCVSLTILECKLEIQQYASCPLFFSLEMNAESSRSHLIISIIIESTNRTSGAVTKGKVFIISFYMYLSFSSVPKLYNVDNFQLSCTSYYFKFYFICLFV